MLGSASCFLLLCASRFLPCLSTLLAFLCCCFLLLCACCCVLLCASRCLLFVAFSFLLPALAFCFWACFLLMPWLLCVCVCVCVFFFAFGILRPAFPFCFSLPLATFFLLLLLLCFVAWREAKITEKARKNKRKTIRINREATNTVFKNYKTQHLWREQEGKQRREKEQYKDRWKMKGQREGRERRHFVDRDSRYLTRIGLHLAC